MFWPKLHITIIKSKLNFSGVTTLGQSCYQFKFGVNYLHNLHVLFHCILLNKFSADAILSLIEVFNWVKANNTCLTISWTSNGSFHKNHCILGGRNLKLFEFLPQTVPNMLTNCSFNVYNHTLLQKFSFCTEVLLDHRSVYS